MGLDLLEFNSHKIKYECQYCGENNFSAPFTNRLMPHQRYDHKTKTTYITKQLFWGCTKIAHCNHCNCEIAIHFDRRGYSSNYVARLEHSPLMRPFSTCKYQIQFGRFRPWEVVAKRVTIPIIPIESFYTPLCNKHPFSMYGHDAETFLNHQDFIRNRFNAIF